MRASFQKGGCVLLTWGAAQLPCQAGQWWWWRGRGGAGGRCWVDVSVSTLTFFKEKIFFILFKIVYRRRALSCVAKTPVELFFLGLLWIFSSRVCVHVQEVVGVGGGWEIFTIKLDIKGLYNRSRATWRRGVMYRANTCTHTYTQTQARKHTYAHSHRSTGNK